MIKKRTLFSFLLIIMFAVPSLAQEKVISYDLKFGFIKGGEARLVISDTIYRDTKAIQYHLVGRTTGVTDKLFDVNDIYTTIVDAKTKLPLKSIRNIQESKYRWYNETLYYHELDSIYSQKSGWRDAPENLVDIISVFFYFIDHHLVKNVENGEQVTLPTFHADKIQDVTIKYMGDTTIDTSLGKVDCHVLAPVVDKGKLLRRSDGLKFFISKSSKIPVMLEFDMRVGALRAELTGFTIDGKNQTKEVVAR